MKQDIFCQSKQSLKGTELWFLLAKSKIRQEKPDFGPYFPDLKNHLSMNFYMISFIVPVDRYFCAQMIEFFVFQFCQNGALIAR